jgi:hypothetical protein
MRDLKNDELVLKTISLLAEFLEKKRRGYTLSAEEKYVVDAAIEVLPLSSTFFCSTCAVENESRQALEGFQDCREHMRAWFEQKPTAVPESMPSLLTSKTQKRTKAEQVQFVLNLLSRKDMGTPPSVADRMEAHAIAARAHLAVDACAVAMSHEGLCPQCEREGHYWPACEDFPFCREHLHEAIDAKVKMT